MHRFLYFSLLTIFLTASTVSADVVTVKGTATYYGDKTTSRSLCEARALDAAKIDALSKKFGTVVRQELTQSESVRNGTEQSHFLSLSATDVKGEWLGTLEEPEYKVSLDNDGNYIVECRVKGKAREISNRAPDFEALALRNTPHKRHASSDFKDGDYIYLYFTAASDGYVAVFLLSEDMKVMKLLPYPLDTKDEVLVRRNYEYVFFDENRAGDFQNVQQGLTLSAPDGEEFNKMYVLFSPNKFTMPLMKQPDASMPPMMDFTDFSQWLIKTRAADPEMGVSQSTIRIK